MRYFIADHLGSIAVITDETGAVAERLSYDAWGKRRYPNGDDDPAGSIASLTTRGFTGEEHIAELGLVNLNARLYDPELGRFMAADPIANPFDAQNLNRYTYALNNPLTITDPSGLENNVSGEESSIQYIRTFYEAPYEVTVWGHRLPDRHRALRQRHCPVVAILGLPEHDRIRPWIVIGRRDSKGFPFSHRCFEKPLDQVGKVCGCDLGGCREEPRELIVAESPLSCRRDRRFGHLAERVFGKAEVPFPHRGLE